MDGKFYLTIKYEFNKIINIIDTSTKTLVIIVIFRDSESNDKQIKTWKESHVRLFIRG